MGSGPSQPRHANGIEQRSSFNSRPPRQPVHDPAESVSSLCWWPELVNGIEETWMTGSVDGTMRLCAMDGSGGCRVLLDWKHASSGAQLCKICYVSGTNFLASSGRDKLVRLWHVKTLPYAVCGFPGYPAPAAGDAITSSESQSSDQPDCNILPQLHNTPVVAMATPPGDAWRATQMVTGARDSSLGLWDIARMQNISFSQTSRNVVTHLCWNPWDGNEIYQTSEDRIMKLWDARTMRLGVQFGTTTHIINDCDVGGDGHTIATSHLAGPYSPSGQVLIWDSRQPAKPVKTITSFDRVQYRTKFCSIKGGTWVASIGDGRASVWDVSEAEEALNGSEAAIATQDTMAQGRPLALGWSPRTRRICCAGDAGGVTILQWSEHTKELRHIAEF